MRLSPLLRRDVCDWMTESESWSGQVDWNVLGLKQNTDEIQIFLSWFKCGANVTMRVKEGLKGRVLWFMVV